MNRFVRRTLCLLLIGFMGMGSVGLGLCICAVGGAEPGVGCCGDCQSTDYGPDRLQNADTAIFAATRGDSSTDCMCVSFPSGAMRRASSQDSMLSLSIKMLFLPAYHAACFDHESGAGVRSNLFLAQRTSMRTSAFLLAQRTVVLLI
ncbi:MAG: hypothetical protein ABR578_08120 [Chromatocurvus sp.]